MSERTYCCPTDRLFHEPRDTGPELPPEQLAGMRAFIDHQDRVMGPQRCYPSEARMTANIAAVADAVKRKGGPI